VLSVGLKLGLPAGFSVGGVVVVIGVAVGFRV
jgi:hypothetical protein